MFTLYAGVEVRRGTELLFDVESTGGRGISDALGLAGFTDVDVVRNPDLGPKPYIARIMVHHQARSRSRRETHFRFRKQFPGERLEIRLGKAGEKNAGVGPGVAHDGAGSGSQGGAPTRFPRNWLRTQSECSRTVFPLDSDDSDHNVSN